MEPINQTHFHPISSDPNTSSAASPSPFFFSYPRLFNTSFNLSTQSVPFQGSSTLMTAIISLTVFMVGLTGNTLAIYVVLRYAKMKTVTNIYIMNLAVADELYIIGLPFLTTQNVLSYWPFGSFLCRLVMTADSMNQFTSIFCLTVMSIDRYLAVVHPIRSTRWRHPRVARVVSAAVWGVSFVVVLPVVIFSDVQDTFNSCNMNWPEPKHVWSTAFILYTATVGFFGPLLIICLCYLLIVIKVCKVQFPTKVLSPVNIYPLLSFVPLSSYPLAEPGSSFRSRVSFFSVFIIVITVTFTLHTIFQIKLSLVFIWKVKSSGARVGFTKRRRSERKVTRMVVVIVVVFVLCWLPFFIINMVNLVVIIPESSITAGIYFFAVILSYVNSCANPVLYGFLSDNFKQSFRKVLSVRSMKCKSNGVDDGDPSAPRTEKTTAHDCILLSPHNQVYLDPQSSQVSPHPPGSPTSHTAADLHCSTPSCQSPSTIPGTGPTTTMVTSKSTSAEAPTITALTTTTSSDAIAPCVTKKQ
uniref:somatostatin receptor type 5 isoform X1 n=1 Tax=Monopterus albus TaxID=43700 RepID=UPI0009B37AEA|nr:somatostatin receptor type 5-like isoform X1 [Monopterus albus]XP_020451953.1 somatostatin receptor type 5-like isoform X1 [Monopterus albus]